jgi:hypothetical protein
VVANNLILATAVVPANVQEHEAAAPLLAAAAEHGSIETVDIDRGYLASSRILELHRDGTVINSRPWVPTNKGLFTKDDFAINIRRREVTCPNGKIAKAVDSGKAAFAVEDCARCKLKASCTTSSHRSVTLHPAEDLLIKLRRNNATKAGRAELRERVAVEHHLARIGGIQGDTARYAGARKNELDLNRSAAIANLHEVARRRAA